MKLKVSNLSQMIMGEIAILCPHCGHWGTFSVIGHDLGISNEVVCGQRRCPNPKCSGHLFVVFEENRLAVTYPHVRVDFDATAVPQNVQKTFDEALDCHAGNCFIAAAIMVRRTLEEICEDRGAKGDNLQERIKNLKSQIVLPTELIEAMDELRLLGNDAAHIEAKTYATISKPELDAAIEFTKEIIKGLYQYASLLSQLRGLKAPKSP